MDRVITKAAERAQAELDQVKARADREGWDVDRIEQEKWAAALRHDVTVCNSRGCLALATGVPGFRDLVLCPRCEQAKRDGG